MAQVDVKWPSEDEEFDTSTDVGGDEPKKVNVVEHTEDSQAAEPESVITPDEAPEEASVEPESNEGDGQNTPDTAPEVPEETVSESEEPVSEDTTEAADEPAEPEVETPAQAESASEPQVEPAVEPETPAETPEPVAEPVLGTPSEPVAVSEPANVVPSSNETEKPPITPVASKKSSHMGRNLIFVALILVIGGLAAWSWTLYSDRNNLQNQVTALKKNPQDEIQRQSKEIISKVDAQINLPQGENPTIANVTDAAAAKKESEFFANAQNGDKVLVYVNAGVAVLYRPSTNRVILVAPLTLEQQAGTTSTNTNTQVPANNARGTTNGNTLQ